jgi:hypothetical protein
VEEVARTLRAIKEHFCGKTFRLLIVGRFKTGKSTLLNALLGSFTCQVPELEERGGPMPVDDLPCTATLTKLIYNEIPTVRAFFFNGVQQEWTFAEYVEKARLKDEQTGKDNSHLFEKIEEFEIGFPSQTLQVGVEFGDSPGHDEDPRRTEATMRALVQTDAAIIVFQSAAFAGESELKFQRDAVDINAKHLFTVVNLWNGRQADRRLITHVLDRLGKDPDSEPREHDIYFVDAQAAQRAVYSGDEALRATSGLEELETRITEFLLSDAYRIFVEATLEKAFNRAGTLKETTAESRAVLTAKVTQIKNVLDANDADLEELQSRADRFARKVQNAKQRASREARSSFERLLLRIESDLPIRVQRSKIESLQSWGGRIVGQFSSRPKDEVVRVITNFVDLELRGWATNGADKPGLQHDISIVLDDLADDLAHEAKAIENLLRNMRIRVRNLDPNFRSEEQVIGFMERAAAAGIGLVLMGPGGLVAAGGGWRALIGGSIASIGVGMIAGLAGIAITGPIGIAIAAIAAGLGSISGGAYNLEQRIKDTVIEELRPQLRRLRDTGADEYKVSEKIEEAIDKLHDELSGALDSIISEERQRLRQMRFLSETEHGKKQAMLESLNQADQQIDQAVKQLQMIRSDIEQH